MTLSRSESSASVGAIPEQGNEVARHIARAAARLFASRGYDATSVRMIVEAAGVTKPTLYYHFGSKEGLAHALLTRPLTELVEHVRGLVEAPLPPGEIIAAVFEAHFAFCREDPDRARFVYAIYFGPLGSGLIEEAGRLGEAFSAALLSVAGRLAREGLIDPERTEEFADACRGLIVVTTIDSLYGTKTLSSNAAHRLVANLFHGFGPRPTREESR